mgnify:CR=1 FL=1
MAASRNQIGRVVQSRFIRHNDVVLAGTRVPVSAIKNFAEAGYSADQILSEYPGLSRRDVEAALTFGDKTAA